MKKLTTYLMAFSLILCSCAKEEDVKAVKQEIEDVKASQIAYVDEQINSVKVSINNLQQTDISLQEYIKELQNEIEDLRNADNANAAKIESLEKTVKALQDKDAELKNQIDNLKAYVEAVDKSTRDWASATFCTLEQYNATVTVIAALQVELQGVNNTLTQTISALELSMKNWVSEQLAGYWTIAQTQAKLDALQAVLEDKIDQEVGALQSKLDAQKTSLEAGYKAAITEAITTNNGIIEGKVAAEVATLNSRIDSELEAINTRIYNVEVRLGLVESQLSEIISRIQSMTFVPRYSDGASTMWWNDSNGVKEAKDTIDLLISPASCVGALVDNFKSAIAVNALEVATKVTGEITPLYVYNVFKSNQGCLSIVVNGKMLPDSFFSDSLPMYMYVTITDGNNDRSSDMIKLVPEYRSIPYKLTKPDLVDLGLSVLWATCNLGAEAPEEYGYYYAWGETAPNKGNYTWETYKYGSSLSKYNSTDGKRTLDLEDDAVHVALGGNWRMPTSSECEELYNQCTWVKTDLNGVSGFTVTSKINGNSIFLPCAGARNKTKLELTGTHSRYWSSTINDSYWADVDILATANEQVSFTHFFRYYGFTIRPVVEPLDSDRSPNVLPYKAEYCGISYFDKQEYEDFGSGATFQVKVWANKFKDHTYCDRICAFSAPDFTPSVLLRFNDFTEAGTLNVVCDNWGVHYTVRKETNDYYIFSENEWHVITIVINPTSEKKFDLEVWDNGTFINKVEGTKSNKPFYLKMFQFGMSDYDWINLQLFDGYIDYARVWTRPLSGSEINATLCDVKASLSEGLMVYWQFGDIKNGKCVNRAGDSCYDIDWTNYSYKDIKGDHSEEIESSILTWSDLDKGYICDI